MGRSSRIRYIYRNRYAEAKADMLNLSSKVIKRENEQDKRLDALENEQESPTPTKTDPLATLHVGNQKLCVMTNRKKDMTSTDLRDNLMF